MKCSKCRLERATEFYGPTGNRIVNGYCKKCYEMLIRVCTITSKGVVGAGRLPQEYHEIRDLNRQGTEAIGRKALSPFVMPYLHIEEDKVE